MTKNFPLKEGKHDPFDDLIEPRHSIKKEMYVHSTDLYIMHGVLRKCMHITRTAHTCKYVS